MSSKEVDKKGLKNPKNIVILVVFLAILVGVVVFLISLFTPKTTYTSSGDGTTNTQSLYCTTKSKNVDGTFFDLSNADSASQAIKVIFKNKKIDNISYSATIAYSDNNVAKTEEAKLNTKYGTYVQDDGKNREIFSPNFSTNNNEVKISLYADLKQLNNHLAKIFLIDTNDSISSYTSKVLSTLYKSKGFDCKAKE